LMRIVELGVGAQVNPRYSAEKRLDESSETGIRSGLSRRSL
jgi:hypothetical protein